MADPITPAVSDRICKHMNDDHAEAVALYAQVYGGLKTATAAQMKAIDPKGMDLIAEVEGAATPVRVTFERELQDSEDAHQTLIAMVRQARRAGLEVIWREKYAICRHAIDPFPCSVLRQGPRRC